METSWWNLSAELPLVMAKVGNASHTALSTVFGAFAALPPQRGSADHLWVDVVPTQLGLTIHLNGLPLISTPDESGVAPLLEGSLLGCAVRARRDRAAFHASAVVLDDHTLLFLGEKGSGKSTLAADLAQREGARYLADEVAFVRLSDQRLEPFPKAATLKSGSFSLFPDSATHSDWVRGPVRYFTPACTGRIDQSFLVAAVVFCRYTPGERAALIPVAPEDAVLPLIQQSFGGLVGHEAMLPFITDFASSMPLGALAFSDTTGAVRALRDWLR